MSPLTCSRTRNPSTSPGPRNDSSDVRLALSYDALKISGTPTLRAMAFNARAVASAWSRLSMTQGPAMTTSGAPPPSGTFPSNTRVTARSYQSLQHPYDAVVSAGTVLRARRCA